MATIIVTKPDGSSFPLVSADNKSIITNGEQKISLLGEDVVTISVISVKPIDFGIGDTIEVYGAKYTMNALPEVVKKGNRQYAYSLVFEGVQYELLKSQFLDLDSSGTALSGDFNTMLNLKAFCEMIIRNANRAQPGNNNAGTWRLGSYPETDSRNMSFSAENCLSALQRVCEDFKYEFWIVYDAANGQYVINIGIVGDTKPHQFAYGRAKGLYELARQSVDSENIITRLYAFGSAKNLKSDYRGYSKRLKLPGVEFLEDANAKMNFGTIEATKIFEEIFPHRNGTVTALGGNEYTFSDANMDFDLNEKDSEGNTKWLIAGTAAKISFKTGKLAGYNFELHSYDHTTKTFVLVPYEDERGQTFPAPNVPAFQISAGNSYVIFDIIMPDSYIVNAENELLQAAQNFLDQNKYPRVSYSCILDELYLKRTAGSGTVNNVFEAGDYVTVTDSAMNVDGTVRVQGFVRSIINPYKYTLTLSDFVQVTRLERLISDTTDIKRIIHINKLNNPERIRENWRTMKEMLDMVFDTDNYFNMDRIRPLSIETSMLAVGAKPEQFTTNIILEPNYNANPNLVKVTGGILTHLTIAETARSWDIQSGQTSLESPSTAYYIYLRCFKEAENRNGQVYFSTDQIKVDQDATYYHFLMGVIHSVSPENIRWLTLSYGSTSVNGRFIKTGRIQSADGRTWFDLDTGEICGKIKFIRPAGDITDPEYLLEAFQNITTGEGGLFSPTLIRVGANNSGGIWIEKAGINGMSSDGTGNTVRFYAGGTLLEAINKVNNTGSVKAPFVVTENGKLFASNAVIEGVVNATSGNFYDVNIKSGIIGGFRIHTSYMESNTSSPGKFVLHPSDDGFVAFIDNSKGIWSGIGLNTVPSSSGLVAIARFENKYSGYPLSPNYGIIVDVQGAEYNIAASITGGVVVRGPLSSTSYVEFTPSSSNNVLPIQKGITFFVRGTNTTYLPTLDMIRRTFGLGNSEKFCVKILVIAYYTGTDFYLYPPSGCTIYSWNGTVLSNVHIANGDSWQFALNFDGYTYRAQVFDYLA